MKLYAPAETRYGGMKESGRNQMSEHNDEHRPVRRVLWARLLLILPFISMLWVSSYNSAEPMIAGIPFFYWYQLLWVVIGAVLIAIVYAVER
jgi:cell division protein FtsW (lipid II flippase)